MKTRRPLSHESPGRRDHGYSLIELLVGTAIASVLFGALSVSLVALEGSFQASMYQLDSQGDENRVLAYLSRDLHSTSTIQVSPDGSSCTLTVPSTASTALNLNLGRPLLSLLSSGSPSGSTIRYYRQGSSIIREVDGEASELSSSATLFQITVAGALARMDVAFQPRFSLQSAAPAPPAVQITAFANLLNVSQP